MANINGTNKADNLTGTSAADIIDGKRGNDRIEGGQGNDALIGGAGNDVFVIRAGDGIDVVSDFTIKNGDNSTGDRVMFDIYGGYSDVLFLGAAYDGFVYTTPQGGTFTFTNVDYNDDGITDVQILADTGDGIVLLGNAAEDLTGASFMGG